MKMTVKAKWHWNAGLIYWCGLITIAATLPASKAATEESGTAERSAVIATVERVREAGLQRDVQALGQLYAPEYFHTNADGSILTREDVLQSYRVAPTMSFSGSESSEQKVIVRGTFAIVSERLALHGKTAAAEPFISNYRVTYVLEQAEGTWRIINSHASLLGIDKHPAN